MNPIIFRCEKTLPLSAEEIAGRILQVANWPDFRGYGPIPAIAAAEFEIRTPEIVGTRIRVRNQDGSNHVEEITRWLPGGRLSLQMKEFSPPLSRLAEKFDETWELSLLGNGATHVVREFRLHPRSIMARAVLWCVSFFLKRAVTRHLTQMKSAASG